MGSHLGGKTRIKRLQKGHWLVNRIPNICLHLVEYLSKLSLILVSLQNLPLILFEVHSAVDRILFR